MVRITRWVLTISVTIWFSIRSRRYREVTSSLSSTRLTPFLLMRRVLRLSSAVRVSSQQTFTDRQMPLPRPLKWLRLPRWMKSRTPSQPMRATMLLTKRLKQQHLHRTVLKRLSLTSMFQTLWRWKTPLFFITSIRQSRLMVL